LKKYRNATNNHAQLIVFSLLGLNGLLVLKFVEVESKLDQGKLSHPQPTEESNAPNHSKAKLATHNHAQSTVKCQTGANGPFAQCHAEVVNKLEADRFSKTLLLEALNVQHNKKLKTVTSAHAQLIVLCLNGPRSDLATKNVAEESNSELEW